MLRVIKKNLVTKCLEMFAEISAKKEHYKKFHEHFGKRMTPASVRTQRIELRSLSCCGSTLRILERSKISLKEYVDRMKDGQNDIFYMTGESIALLSSSPFLENCRKKGLEILYMVDPVTNP